MIDARERARVAVVFGGRSPEHGISCLSAAGVLSQMDRDRYEVTAIGITPTGDWCRVSDDAAAWQRDGDRLPQVDGITASAAELLVDVDVVFPVLHGRNGEDGTVQGLFEMLDVAYVGSGVLASALCMDKAMTKSVLRSADVPVGDWIAATGAQWERDRERIATGVRELGLPIFVKPARAGSSVGITKVTRTDHVATAIAEALRHDSKFIAERAVLSAREIEVGAIADAERPTRVSAPAEIVVASGHDFYDFAAKYLDGSSRLCVPAELEPVVAKTLMDLTVLAFEVLGCAGLARVDFFVTSDGRVTLNEVNTMPGFTASSGFPKMWEAAGLGYQDLITHLIEDALTRACSGG